ncbi:MAG TPA: TetR/AcrR family transcriptional regulator [Solirubrobacteraceae bacterium]|jgi:AcrR family transcriptional regulator
MGSSDTRERVLEAALASFLKDGYEQTTVARITERSGVSNGALFHHFPSKDAIAEALYLEAMSSFQEGLWQLVRSRPRSLRGAVRGTIGHQLSWTEGHADLARFVYLRGHLDWDSPAGAQLQSLNRDLAGAFEQWMAPLVERGEIRDTSMLLISAIVNGPAHAIARRWLAGHLQSPPSTFLAELTDAACAALRGTPVRTRSRPKPLPPRGRVTLEILREDGAVLAQGSAVAHLHPAGSDRTELAGARA